MNAKADQGAFGSDVVVDLVARIGECPAEVLSLRPGPLPFVLQLK